MFNLGIQAEKTHRKPYIPMLKENNVRTGFFEHGEFVAFRGASPDYLQPVATISMRELFASIQGPPRTTRGRLLFLMANCWKRFRSNGSGARLRRSPDNPLPLLCPFVFHREGKPIKDFRDAWNKAREATGLASKILHDFRRTAVRDMVRAGVHERVAMMISSHKTRLQISAVG